MDEKKYEETDRDLMGDFDESKLDRVGKPLGVEEHDAGRPDDAPPPEEQKKSHTLNDMSEDYEFFTTACIHALTPFDRDPVAEFNRIHPVSHNAEQPLIIDATQPFFEGLGVCLLAGHPVNFDRRLYAILRDRWDLLRDTIAGIAMMHRKSDFYGRINFYEMEIADQFAIKKMSVVDHVPIVPITVFGVSTNKVFGYLEPREFPQLPTLVKEPPKEDMKIEGASVLGPPPSPEHLLPKEKQE